jgi:hypothetical protein
MAEHFEDGRAKLSDRDSPTNRRKSAAILLRFPKETSKRLNSLQKRTP